MTVAHELPRLGRPSGLAHGLTGAIAVVGLSLWLSASQARAQAAPGEPPVLRVVATPAGDAAPAASRGLVAAPQGPSAAELYLAALSEISTPPVTRKPLQVPGDLPGSSAPPIRLPPVEQGRPNTVREEAIRRLFAELPPLAAPVMPQPGPCGHPLTLPELQEMAAAQNPLIHQAVSDITTAQGNAIQAGAYPNPHVGYQSDDVGTGATAGYQGINITQTIATGGKLQLARAAAMVDVENAQLALRAARSDLDTRVRTAYFALLVALEKVRVNRALSEFTDNVYKVQIERVRIGEAAAYEPLQLRVLAFQARAQLVQAVNDYYNGWRQLAAALNCPSMPPTEVAGDVLRPVPQVNYETALEIISHCHTSLISAQNSVTKARLNLRLARITPWIPDIDTTAVVEYDNTTPPYNTVVSLQVGAPIPIWDRNRGNIMAAEGTLIRGTHEYDRARNDLANTLSDAFSRYQTNVTLAQYHSTAILGDQFRVYQGIYQRYQQDPDNVAFNDVVTAQQTLAQVITTYVQALGDQWQAVIDLASVLQAPDMFNLGECNQPSGEPVSSGTVEGGVPQPGEAVPVPTPRK